MNLLAGLVAVVALNAPPFDFGDSLQVMGQIQKPTVFTVVQPPAELQLHVAPSAAELARAEARLGRGERRAVDFITRARGLAVAERTRLDEATDRWLAAQECSTGPCPDAGEPPVADYRPALAALADAGATRDVEPVQPERLALEAVLALEPGPGYDEARGAAALGRVVDMVTRGPLAAWARFVVAERAFDASDLAYARAMYEAALAADPTTALGPFVRYKIGWTLVNLDELDLAAAAFRSIIDDAALAPGGPGEMLANEARRDLVVVYAMRPERVDDAVDFFVGRAAPSTNTDLLRLAEAYFDSGHRDAARVVMAALERRVLSADEARELERLRVTTRGL